MGRRQSYITSDEIRNDTRVTLFQKHKQRVSIVLAVNAQDDHFLLVNYISSPQSPIFFPQRLQHFKATFNSQKNRWMDGEGSKTDFLEVF